MRGPAAPKQTATRASRQQASARLVRSVPLSWPPSITTMDLGAKAVRAFSTESVFVALESLTKCTPATSPQGSMRCSMGLNPVSPRATTASSTPTNSASAEAARAFSQLWLPRILRLSTQPRSCSTPSRRTTSSPPRTNAASGPPSSRSMESSHTRRPRPEQRTATSRHQSSSMDTTARSPAPILAKIFSFAAA